jgi:hypothetical protein
MLTLLSANVELIGGEGYSESGRVLWKSDISESRRRRIVVFVRKANMGFV